MDEVDLNAPAVARRLHAPIVGRHEELALLRGALDRTAHERGCRLFTIVGTAGIGKSRLVAEFCRSVGDVAVTVTGRCLSYGEGITYWPLFEIVRDLGGEQRLLQALAGEADAEVVAGLLRGAIRGSAEAGTPDQTFWAVRRVFERLARERPLVVCFEDIHWAEPTFLDLIEYLTGWSNEAPLLVVCLARPELIEKRPGWFVPHERADAIALEPLSRGEVGALLDALSEGDSLAADRRERIALAAEGNPLFVEQIAAMASEEQESGNLRVPPSINALLSERLDRLTPEERGVIERASVIGRDFPAGAIVALSPPDERDSVGHHLMALARKGFVRPDDSEPTSEVRFRFQHALVRDAAYAALSKAARAELHERLADLVEGGGAWEERDEILGYHLEQAYRSRIDIAPLDEDAVALAGRAGTHLSAAGQHALARGDSPAAVSILERARSLTSVSGETPSSVLLDLGGALRECARLEEADAVLAQAITASYRSGSRKIQVRAELERLFAQIHRTSPLDEFRKVADEAASIASDDPVLRAKARMLSAVVDFVRGRMVSAEAALEDALEDAERGRDRRQARDTLIRLLRVTLFGPLRADRALVRIADLKLRAPGDRVVEALTATVQAQLEAMRGQFDDARRLYGEAHALLADLGRPTMLAASRLDAAAVERLAGDMERAEEELRASVEVSVAAGERSNPSTFAAVLAETLVERGNLVEAEQYLDLSDEMTDDEDVFSQIVRRIARAKLLLRRDVPETAVRLAHEAVAIAATTDIPLLQAAALSVYGEGLQASRRYDAGDASLRRAQQRYEAKGNVVSAAWISDVRRRAAMTMRSEKPS